MANFSFSSQGATPKNSTGLYNKRPVNIDSAIKSGGLTLDGFMPPKTTPTVTNTGTGNNSSYWGNNGGSSMTKTMTTGTTTPTSTPEPTYYAKKYEDTANEAKGLVDSYSERIATPYSQPGIGTTQKSMSDYETKRLETKLGGYTPLLTAYSGLLGASTPKSIGPTDRLYNPITGDVSTKTGNASDLVFGAGELNKRAEQGGQNVDLGTKKNTIYNLMSGLGQDSTSQITALNSVARSIAQGVSDTNTANFKSLMGAVSQQLVGTNDDLAKKLLDYTKNGFGSQDIPTIMSAIGTALNSIQTQQNSLQSGGTTTNRNTSTGAIVETSAGKVNNAWFQ